MRTKDNSNTVMAKTFPRPKEPTWRDNVEYLFKTKIDSETNLSGATNVVWQETSVARDHREKMNGHRGLNLWFTGLSGSGKSTLANAVEERLHHMGYRTFLLDGDNVRHGLCSDLGFSREERSENIRRIAEIVKLFLENGIIILTTFISPFQADRKMVRELVPDGDFVEVFCRCPLETCEKRDVKGLYKLARAGKIKNYTGISSPYEKPEDSDVVVDTGNQPLEESVHTVLQQLKEMQVITSRRLNDEIGAYNVA